MFMKKLRFPLIILTVFVLTICYGFYTNPDSELTLSEIYSSEYQNACYESLIEERDESEHTLQSIFMKYNPFSSNTLSMYIYFETEQASKITYTISADGYADFTQTAYQAKEYQKIHEFQLIGLIPDCLNTITFTAEFKDGTKQSVTKTYKMSSLMSSWGQVQLEKTVSNDSVDLGSGLYAVLGNDSDDGDFVYLYDTNGIVRGEIPIFGYRSHRLLFDGTTMWMSVSEKKMASIDHLGQITNVYDLGDYSLHHDYAFDADGNLLILATDTTQDTVEDQVVRLDLDSGDVELVMDFEDYLGDYKATTTQTKSWDWLHFNTIQYTEDDGIILSSRETSTIMKVKNISTEPEIQYFIGNSDLWQESGYDDYCLTQIGDFLNTGGQHTVTYETSDELEDGQYYLYLFNNNFGYSKTNPDYDWSSHEGLQTSVTEGTTSYYYQYLVDENAGTYTLVDSFEVPYSAYVSSVQKVNDYIVVDSGIPALLGVYDQDGNLLEQFQLVKNKKIIYRIYYYDFSGYYFN